MKKKIITQQAKKALDTYGACELLLVGLNEIGLLGGKEYWWECELFQVGLKELGLAA